MYDEDEVDGECQSRVDEYPDDGLRNEAAVAVVAGLRPGVNV